MACHGMASDVDDVYINAISVRLAMTYEVIILFHACCLVGQRKLNDDVQRK